MKTLHFILFSILILNSCTTKNDKAKANIQRSGVNASDHSEIIEKTNQSKPEVFLPAWFKNAFKNKGLDSRYDLNTFLKPTYFLVDFNGDSNQDIAVVVTEKATQKKGILLIHGKTNDYFLFGAGTKFGSGSDNFEWAGKWTIYKKKTAHETQFDENSGDIIGSKEIKLKRPALLVEDIEDGAAIAGGIIYWDDKKYIWIHQGE